MTDEIRRAVWEKLQREGKSQRQFANELGRHPQYLWDLLHGKSGNMPKSWQEILSALGLELYVRDVTEIDAGSSR